MTPAARLATAAPARHGPCRAGGPGGERLLRPRLRRPPRQRRRRRELQRQLGSDPGWNLGQVGFGLGAGIEGDTDGDIWAGAGPTVVWPFASHWAATGSLMAGFYAVGDGGDDLGSDLEFRTRVGVNRSIAFPWRMGVAIEHKSNGGLGDSNPGVETVFLTFSRPIAGWGYR